MKKRMIHFIALLLLVGCAREPTVVTETYPNGQKKEVGGILNDRKEGKWGWWYASGQKRGEAIYSNGKKNGPAAYWFENGNLDRKGEFRKDRLHHEWTFWYPSSEKRSIATYLRGQFHGPYGLSLIHISEPTRPERIWGGVVWV